MVRILRGRVADLVVPITLLAAIALSTGTSIGGDAVTPPLELARAIDARLDAHWKGRGIAPAISADNGTLFRRATLDLTGRIPTRGEWEPYLADKAPPEERYRAFVDRTLNGPEFALHFGATLDAMLQGSSAGNAEFVDYLRRRVRERASWDAIFRELMLGPWKADDAKPAQRFLEVRAKDMDRLTADAARVFFGVDITCARCHDHPLVNDWKQDHYYGMVSFFNRTTGGKGSVGEKNDGDVQFRTAAGEQKTARMMFLSGRVVDDLKAADGKTPVSRRQRLVDAALDDRAFLARSMVNRLWRQFFGRGLVDPVDQMHSANGSSVPDLIEFLADDFAASGYDLRRLVEALVLTKAYRLGSRWENGEPPDEEHFAVARLRPLTRRQYSLSLLVATGGVPFEPGDATATRVERIAGVPGLSRMRQVLAAEEQAAAFRNGLDPGTDSQSTSGEALYVSNSEPIRALFVANGAAWTAKLAAMSESRAIVDAAVRQILSRPPTVEEVDELAAWLDARTGDKARACEEMTWALATSAEFRFNH